MTYLILILVLIIIIFFLIIFREKIKEVVAYRSKRQEQKEKGKKRIIEELTLRQVSTPSSTRGAQGKQAKITNDDVQKLLGVSDATATNYLQELENERKINQVGKRGRFVYYRSFKING